MSTEIPAETPQDKPAKQPRKVRALPRGYRVEARKDGRKKPFVLIVHGKHNEAFEKEADALSAGHDLAEKEKEFGREVRAFDVPEWRRYQEAKRLYFGGTEPDWPRLANGLKTELGTVLVANAAVKYEALKKSENLASFSHIKKRLSRLVEAFGTLEIGRVETGKLREWLTALADELDFDPWTVRGHLKTAKAFFNWAKLEKLCAENPCDPIKPPKILKKKINILTVDEMARLFEKNKNFPVVGKLALEAFGGVRFSSAGRLVLADLKFADKGIELPASRLVENGDGSPEWINNHKSEDRHYIDGLPSNLWEWLKAAPAECWELTERQYERAKIEAFVRAGFAADGRDERKNCLRHSFATYHVAWKKDAASTAVLMQHTSPAILYRHYKGRGTHADGLKYFKIMPT